MSDVVMVPYSIPLKKDFSSLLKFPKPPFLYKIVCVFVSLLNVLLYPDMIKSESPSRSQSKKMLLESPTGIIFVSFSSKNIFFFELKEKKLQLIKL